MSDTAAQIWKDRYEIERPLGRGGMSAVFVAKDRQLLSKRVVVKVLLEEMNEDAWVRQKFFQEMEALARIDHPGVVGVLDTGQTPEGKQFLVMQYIEGEALRSAIQPGGMPLARAASLLRQIGQALGAAHEAGVWHRDLKPENVMLQRSGGEEYAKLIDFGIAGIQNSQFTGEKTKIAGSVTYMAPEQFSGNPCAASDIYALGVMAYEMLTGEPPFPASSMAHLVAQAQNMPLLRSARPDVGEAAERAIVKALTFRPEARQSSVREFTEEMYSALCASEPARRLAGQAPAGASLVTADTGQAELKPAGAAPPKRKSKAPIAIALGVVLLGVAAAGWFAMRPKASPAPAAARLELDYTVEGSPDKVAFRVATPAAGYLYLLSYGKDGDRWTFNLLHPLNSGNAHRAAGQTLRLPEENWYVSNGVGPRDVPYLVWAAEPVREIETLKLLRQDHGVAIVDDPAQVAQVRQFLESHRSEASRKDGRTEVRTSDSVLVHEMPLEKP